MYLFSIISINSHHPADKSEQHQRLTAERDLYERTKKELNHKLRDLKEIHDKENQEANLRFNSLQQQYKILKTQHDDLTQHCEKVKKDLATDNDGLKSLLNKLQGQLTKTQSTNENDLTMWKVMRNIGFVMNVTYLISRLNMKVFSVKKKSSKISWIPSKHQMITRNCCN